MSAPLRSLVSLSLFLASFGVAYAQDDDASLMDSLEDADGSPGDAPALQEDEEEEEEDEYEYPEDRDEAEAAAAADDDSERRPLIPPEPASGGDKVKWKVGKPGLDPAVGAFIGPDGGALALGVEASLPIYQDTTEKFRWGGRTRAIGQVLLGADPLFGGYAVRVGAFGGPRYKPFSIDFGPDFFYNVYNVAGLDGAPFSGVGLPLTLNMSVPGFGLYGGVEPAWYVSGDWPSVDWAEQDLFGFGDEFTYIVGGGFSTQSLSLGLGYTHRITGFGVLRGVSVGLGF